MTDSLIPSTVRQFLAIYVPSVAHLEALLLLRAEPDETWTLDALSRRLFISTAEIASVVTDLASRGLIASPSEGAAGYAYAPASAALQADVDEAAEAYRTRLLAVTQFIHARQPSSLEQFAHAFRIRKD